MISVAWLPRPEPLIPEAVFLPRKPLKANLGALIGRELRGVAIDDGLVVLGKQDDLPWVPGAFFFARSPDARDVYLPTGLRPQVPELLVARAVRRLVRSEKRNLANVAGPFVVVPEIWGVGRPLIISVSAASLIDHDELFAWLGGSA